MRHPSPHPHLPPLPLPNVPTNHGINPSQALRSFKSSPETILSSPIKRDRLRRRRHIMVPLPLTTCTYSANQLVSHNTKCSLKCGIQCSRNRTETKSDIPTYREALNIPKTTDILHHVRSLPTTTERALAAQKIRVIEEKAMLSQEPQPGLVELMEYLQSRGVKRGLCTRNFEYVTFLRPLGLAG